jgi:hypothetical protein
MISEASIPKDNLNCNDNMFVTNDCSAFEHIYNQSINLSIWHRSLDCNIKKAVEELVDSNKNIELSASVAFAGVEKMLEKELGRTKHSAHLYKDIATLAEMYCCLFDAKGVGLRLTTLKKAMCPRFHVDKVTCRLITTYHGVATEWLPNNVIDRKKLGLGNNGKPDDVSGLYQSQSNIQQIKSGDVALLKGESWEGNEGLGIVHRSPKVLDGDFRLLLTLDFVDM